MNTEDGSWVVRGLEWDDPYRIRTPRELINYINQVGFLPLFANEVPGFSVEEHVSPLFWWTDDPEQDPWKWREILARSGEVIYGKFFHQKTGFVSLEWFPAFANFRRDGYDFDSLWEDGLASRRCKVIMDQFETEQELNSADLKKKAGFGKDGLKNFDGTVAELQMKGYLVVRDFRKKTRKKDGVAYGWPISVYTTPENLLGREPIAEAYREKPEVSGKRIFARIQEEYPWATEEQLRKVLGR